MDQSDNCSDDEPHEAISHQIIDYYKKYSQNRDLPKYFSGSSLSYMLKISSDDETPASNTEPTLAPPKIDIFLDDEPEAKLISPASSTISIKKLEWDNGADIGYSNCQQEPKMHKSASLPTVFTADSRSSDEKTTQTQMYTTSSSSSASIPPKTPIISSSSSVSAQTRPTSSSSSHATTLAFIKTQIGAPDAESTPRIAENRPIFYMETPLAAEKREVKKNILELCRTKPIVVECLDEGPKGLDKNCQTSLDGSLKKGGKKNDCVEKRGGSDDFVRNQSVEGSGGSEAASFEYFGEKGGGDCQKSDCSSPHSSVPILAQLISQNLSKNLGQDVDNSIEILQKLLKSKKYDPETKKRYIKKIVKKIVDSKYATDSTTSSEQIEKNTNLSTKTTVDEFIPETSSSSSWKEEKTLSEQVRRGEGDQVVKFARKERQNQLEWVNNEITHLTKLKGLLERNQAPEHHKTTTVYMLTTPNKKICPKGSCCPCSKTHARNYVIETDLTSSSSDSIEYRFKNGKYLVREEGKPASASGKVVGDVHVKTKDNVTNIKVRTERAGACFQPKRPSLVGDQSHGAFVANTEFCMPCGMPKLRIEASKDYCWPCGMPKRGVKLDENTIGAKKICNEGMQCKICCESKESDSQTTDDNKKYRNASSSYSDDEKAKEATRKVKICNEGVQCKSGCVCKETQTGASVIGSDAIEKVDRRSSKICSESVQCKIGCQCKDFDTQTPKDEGKNRICGKGVQCRTGCECKDAQTGRSKRDKDKAKKEKCPKDCDCDDVLRDKIRAILSEDAKKGSKSTKSSHKTKPGTNEAKYTRTESKERRGSNQSHLSDLAAIKDRLAAIGSDTTNRRNNNAEGSIHSSKDHECQYKLEIMRFQGKQQTSTSNGKKTGTLSQETFPLKEILSRDLGHPSYQSVLGVIPENVPTVSSSEADKKRRKDQYIANENLGKESRLAKKSSSGSETYRIGSVDIRDKESYESRLVENRERRKTSICSSYRSDDEPGKKQTLATSSVRGQSEKDENGQRINENQEGRDELRKKGIKKSLNKSINSDESDDIETESRTESSSRKSYKGRNELRKKDTKKLSNRRRDSGESDDNDTESKKSGVSRKRNKDRDELRKKDMKFFLNKSINSDESGDNDTDSRMDGSSRKSYKDRDELQKKDTKKVSNRSSDSGESDDTESRKSSSRKSYKDRDELRKKERDKFSNKSIDSDISGDNGDGGSSRKRNNHRDKLRKKDTKKSSNRSIDSDESGDNVTVSSKGGLSEKRNKDRHYDQSKLRGKQTNDDRNDSLRRGNKNKFRDERSKKTTNQSSDSKESDKDSILGPRKRYENNSSSISDEESDDSNEVKSKELKKGTKECYCCTCDDETNSEDLEDARKQGKRKKEDKGCICCFCDEKTSTTELDVLKKHEEDLRKKEEEFRKKQEEIEESKRMRLHDATSQSVTDQADKEAGDHRGSVDSTSQTDKLAKNDKIVRKVGSSDLSQKSDSSISSSSSSNTSKSVGYCVCCKKDSFPSTALQLLKDQFNKETVPLCHPCYRQYCAAPNQNAYRNPGHICGCYTLINRQTLTEIRQTINKLSVYECYCEKSGVCKHCRNKLGKTSSGKNGIAYMLTFDETEAVPFEGHKKDRKKRRLEEIKIKIPVMKKKHKDKANKKKKKKKRERAKEDDELSDNICSSLQEYLCRNRPSFVELAEERRKVLLDSRYVREIHSETKKLCFLEAYSDTDCPNTAQHRSTKRIFSAKEMREINRKNYKKLPEVQQKLHDNREKQLRQANRLIADTFNKKLRDNVLKGKLTISADVNVVNL